MHVFPCMRKKESCKKKIFQVNYVIFLFPLMRRIPMFPTVFQMIFYQTYSCKLKEAGKF